MQVVNSCPDIMWLDFGKLPKLSHYHFIGPANDYTLIHYTYTVQLPALFNWSAFLEQVLPTSFANPVNSQLRQWDSWRALHGRHGSEIHPSDSKTSLRPSKHVWAYGWHLLDLYVASSNIPNGGFNLPLAIQPPSPPALLLSACPPPITCYLWYYSGFEKVAQNPVVLAS